MATESEIKDLAIKSRDKDIAFLRRQLAEARKQAFLDADVTRAVEMLTIAAKYIRTFHCDGEIFYDETDCDGYCVADDCESIAEALRREAEKQRPEE